MTTSNSIKVKPEAFDSQGLDWRGGFIALISIESVTQHSSHNARPVPNPGEETREAQLHNGPLLDDLGMESFCSAARGATID